MKTGQQRTTDYNLDKREMRKELWKVQDDAQNDDDRTCVTCGRMQGSW